MKSFGKVYELERSDLSISRTVAWLRPSTKPSESVLHRFCNAYAFQSAEVYSTKWIMDRHNGTGKKSRSYLCTGTYLEKRR